jgi:hypothetical protein
MRNLRRLEKSLRSSRVFAGSNFIRKLHATLPKWFLFLTGTEKGRSGELSE